MWRCHGDALSERCDDSSMDPVQTTSAERALVTGHLLRDVSVYVQKYNNYAGGRPRSYERSILFTLITTSCMTTSKQGQ